jgi:hypothetical protein
LPQRSQSQEDGNRYGEKIEGLMNKIHRKKQGSNSFKKALRERDYYINETLKTIAFGDIKTIVLENIKSIKKNTKKEKRLHKEFRSKSRDGFMQD